MSSHFYEYSTTNRNYSRNVGKTLIDTIVNNTSSQNQNIELREKNPTKKTLLIAMIKAARHLPLLLSLVICLSVRVKAESESTILDSSSCDRCPSRLFCTLHSERVPGSSLFEETEGTYFTCSCREGYNQVGNHPWNCQDRNECVEDNACSFEGGFCVNTFPDNEAFPQYQCGCDIGFLTTGTDVHGATGCAEIGLIDTATAAPVTPEPTPAPTKSPTTCAATCTGDNTECDDNDDCVCQQGFFRFNAASPNCLDENECQDGFPNNCDRFASCTNTVGSYVCSCNDGYEDAPTSTTPGTDCVNINECEEGKDNCAPDTICVDRNPPQKFECLSPTPAPTPPPTRAPDPASCGACESDDDCRGNLKCFSLPPDAEPDAFGCPGNNNDSFCVSSNTLRFTEDEGDNYSLCDGDCDHDFDCGEGLICYMRHANQENVPGCIGDASVLGDLAEDFCIPEGLFPEYNGDLVFVSGSGSDLGECEGNCMSDDDCAGNLKCFFRNGPGPNVSGCEGNADTVAGGEWSFCVAENALRFTEDGGNNYGLCDGDCDSDDDCGVNQVCWQRTTSVSVPGCIGDASVLGDTEEDFCVFDPDLFIEE